MPPLPLYTPTSTSNNARQPNPFLWTERKRLHPRLCSRLFLLLLPYYVLYHVAAAGTHGGSGGTLPKCLLVSWVPRYGTP